MSETRQVNLNGMILTVDEENRVSSIVSNGDLIAVQDTPEHMPVLNYDNENYRPFTGDDEQ